MRFKLLQFPDCIMAKNLEVPVLKDGYTFPVRNYDVVDTFFGDSLADVKEEIIEAIRLQLSEYYPKSPQRLGFRTNGTKLTNIVTDEVFEHEIVGNVFTLNDSHHILFTIKEEQ